MKSSLILVMIIIPFVCCAREAAEDYKRTEDAGLKDNGRAMMRNLLVQKREKDDQEAAAYDAGSSKARNERDAEEANDVKDAEDAKHAEAEDKRIADDGDWSLNCPQTTYYGVISNSVTLECVLEGANLYEDEIFAVIDWMKGPEEYTVIETLKLQHEQSLKTKSHSSYQGRASLKPASDSLAATTDVSLTLSDLEAGDFGDYKVEVIWARGSNFQGIKSVYVTLKDLASDKALDDADDDRDDDNSNNGDEDNDVAEKLEKIKKLKIPDNCKHCDSANT